MITRWPVFVFALSVTCLTIAEQPDESTQTNAKRKIEMVERSVRVIDEGGQPVADAVVKPFGFRTRIERGSHYGWNAQVHGIQTTTRTDTNGLATCRVPKFVYEKLEIGEITWLVDSYDFVMFNGDRSVDDSPAEIKLKSGYRIAATGIDSTTKEPIKKDLYALLSGGGWSENSEWKLKKGTLVSRVFDSERSSLRLIYLPPNEPAKFSKLQTAVRPAIGARTFLKNIPVEPGTRVAGKIDPKVPRPIKAGRVIAYIVSSNSDDRQQYWQWSDVAMIDPDGAFVFDSMPTGEVLQLVAICDEWVSRNPTADELLSVAPWPERWVNRDSRVVPQVFAMKSDEINPVLAMERTATCETLVLKPDGSPLANAEVHMWPNAAFLRGGSRILGTGSRSRELLINIRASKKREHRFLKNDFMARTDNRGIAVLRNLPGKPNVGLAVIHDDFDQSIENNQRATSVPLLSGKTMKITIQMQVKGSDVLGK